MSISRSMPRKGWTLLTAILATIAVIAALLTVPLNKASAAEPTDFVPNTTLGNEDKKEEKSRDDTGEKEGHIAADYNWGLLVWAGAPVGRGTGTGPNEKMTSAGRGALSHMLSPHFKRSKSMKKRTLRSSSLTSPIMML